MTNVDRGTSSPERVAAVAERVAWWCVLAVMVFVPLLTTNTTILGLGTSPLTVDQSDLPRAVTLAVLGWGGLAAWLLACIVQPRRVRWSRSWWLLVAFVALAALSALASSYRSIVYLGDWFHYEGLLMFATYAALFFIAAQTATEARLRTLVRWGAVVGAVLGLYGLVQSFGLDWASWLSMSWPGGRAFATWSNPDFFGGYLLFPLAFSIAVVARDPDRRWKRAGGVSLVLVTLALAMTLTRGAWLVGLLVGAVMLVGLAKRGLSWKVVALVSAAVLLVALGTAYVVTDGAIVQRALSTFSAGDDGSSARILIWQQTLPQAFRSPALGFGPDAYEKVMLEAFSAGGMRSIPTDPHNVVLYLLVTVGVPATLALAGLVVSVLWRSRGPANAYALAVWAAAFGHAVYLLLNVSIVASVAMLFVCLGVLAAAGARKVSPAPLGLAAVAAVAAALLVVSVVFGTRGLLADHAYLNARIADHEGGDRLGWAERARALNPLNERYAQEVESAKAAEQ